MLLELFLIGSVISLISSLGVIYFGKFGPLYLSMGYGILSIIWGWLGPYENSRQIRLFLILLFAVIIGKKYKFNVNEIKVEFHKKFGAILFLNFFVLLPIFFVNAISSNLAARLLSLGYDHYGHLGLFHRTLITGGFEYSPFASNETINSLAINGYPLLQSSAWSLFLDSLGLRIESSDSLVRYFIYFEILTLLFAVYLFVCTFLQNRKGSASLKTLVLALIFSSGLAFFSPLTNLIWQGFPPTLFGILTTYGTFLILLSNSKFSTRITLVTIGLILTGYAYPIYVPIAGIPLLILLYQNYSSGQRMRFFQISSTTVFALAIFAFPLISVSKALPSYLFNFGGIEPPKVLYVALVLVLVVLVNLQNLRLLSFNVGFYVSLLMGTSLTLYGYFTDTGYYYPLKILYLSLALGFGSLLSALGSNPKSKEGRTSKISDACVFVLFLVSIISTITPNYFANTSTIQVLESKYFGSKCVSSEIAETAKRSDFGKNNVLYVIRNQGTSSDFLTRWFNSLNGKNDDDVFNFAIPYGNAKNQDKFLEEFESSNPKFSLRIFDVVDEESCRLKLYVSE